MNKYLNVNRELVESRFEITQFHRRATLAIQSDKEEKKHYSNTCIVFQTKLRTDS